MKIIVNAKNADRINEEIKKSEGRAKVRTVTYNEIVKGIEEVEERLHIAKADMEGVKVYMDWNAQDFPHAYKYTPESTHVYLIRTKSGWAMYGVDRNTCQRRSGKYELVLTDRAQKAIIAACSRFGG